VPVIAFVGEGHEDPALADGGHAHQRVAQPLLPDGLAVDGQDLQLAALGVEHDVALVDDRRGGAIVGGLVLPGEGPVGGVEGEEVIAPEASPQEDAAVDHGGRRQAMTAREDDPPAPSPAIGAEERRRRPHVGEFPLLTRINLHG
jgi:hypothetical protein